ncbi:MAG: hypothetical protein D6719_10715 [Candidatus Dadabacteria bacterium]|nr:MAG: hypothetical protein D6719_10715 [Candidatus Dadabacteria bacterium]
MNYRKFIIRLFTFLGGIYFFLEFVLPGKVAGVQIDQYHDQISRGFIVVGAMAVGLGLINLLMVHGSKIIFRRKGAINSLALLSGLFLMMFVSGSVWLADLNRANSVRKITSLASFAERIAQDYQIKKKGVKPYYVRNQLLKDAAFKALNELDNSVNKLDLSRLPESSTDSTLLKSLKRDFTVAMMESDNALAKLQVSESDKPDFSANNKVKQSLQTVAFLSREIKSVLYRYSTIRRIYTLLFDGLFVSLGSAMFSLLGFYIAAAAYRAFRIKSAESTLMLLAALLVMLGQIPFSIWIWDGFTDIRLWLLSVPNTAAFRAIKIGAAVAGLVMAIRMWLSIESESFERGTEL